MPLVTLKDAELAYGLTPLLDRAQLTIRAGERVALIGRNGTGKSSLLSVISGARVLDSGEVQRRDGLSIVLVEQEPELAAQEPGRRANGGRRLDDGSVDDGQINGEELDGGAARLGQDR